MDLSPADPSFPDTPRGPVLVAGGAGYIGSHTVALLRARGIPVVVLDNLSQGHRAAVPEEVPLIEADLGDRSAIAAAFAEHAPQAVIHFAALASVGDSVKDPSRYYRENVICTWNLLEEMLAAGVRDIVFSSTCATYGNPLHVPMDESHQQVPINPYGHTKLHMEHMLSDYAQAFDLRYAALRYFNAAGAAQDASLGIGEDHSPESHLIPLILEVALGKRDSIAMFGDDYDTPDGTCIRDYIHVDDLGDAHLRALAQLQAGARELQCNLGTGTGFSVREVIECARDVTGHEIPARVAPRRPGDPPQLVSGGTRARDLLGWVPRRAGLREILEDAWRFHSVNPNGYAD